jgi:hypothetical protein
MSNCNNDQENVKVFPRRQDRRNTIQREHWLQRRRLVARTMGGTGIGR